VSRSSRLFLAWWVGLAAPVAAQQHVHEPSPAQQPAQPDHAQHAGHEGSASSLFSPRDASGTAWLPDATPMYGVHGRTGNWELMGHGTLFAQFLYEGGEAHRRSRQGGSINWIMGMARRPLGAGRFGVRGMASLEPFTIGGCGYPDLLATGERCDGDTIHDRQHPHDLVMELALEYQRPLGRALTWQVYGGPAGEPALGPPAFPHRPSAMPNPIAPIAHHWLDATHITFGVFTAGLQGRRWKAEASAFNGREPDEKRYDLDLAALDSYSGRVTLLPRGSLAIQVSAGRLNDAEAEFGAAPPVDVNRFSASASYHHTMGARGLWATTMAWGANDESGTTSHALVLESVLSPDGAGTWFGRVEAVGKPAHDLHIHGSDNADVVYTVGKAQVGYMRYLPARGGFQTGFGGSVSAAIMPPAVAESYGGRVVAGFGVFVNIRPAMHVMQP
jgi:hypothetical protein